MTARSRATLVALACAVGIGGFVWLLTAAPEAKAQVVLYETGSEVTATCAAAGTTLHLQRNLSYVAKAKVEMVTFKLNTDGDGGVCGAGGTDLDVGAPELVKAKKPSDAIAAAGTYKVCCRSEGGTGVWTLTPVKIEVP